MLEDAKNDLRVLFDNKLTTGILRAAIIGWAVFVVLLALNVSNKWHLAGILAWEVLP